jgi:hypothetical protein
LFAAMLLVVGGVAVATGAIPDSNDGEVHFCYVRASGDVEVIDHQVGRRCSSGERELVLNQRGPTGATGPSGDAARPYAQVFRQDSGEGLPIVQPGGAIAFNEVMAISDFTLNGGSALTASRAGVYDVSFSASTSDGALLQLEVNDTLVRGARDAPGSDLNFDALVTLAAGDSIRVVNVGETLVALNGGSGPSASLQVTFASAPPPPP